MNQHSMHPHVCKHSPKQCFTTACRTGKSSHCGLYLDRNLTGDTIRHGNLGGGPNISWTARHLCYAVSVDYCGRFSLCMAAHSFREVMLAVSLSIPNLTNQLEVRRGAYCISLSVWALRCHAGVSWQICTYWCSSQMCVPIWSQQWVLELQVQTLLLIMSRLTRAEAEVASHTSIRNLNRLSICLLLVIT